jgi:hypothetical protein
MMTNRVRSNVRMGATRLKGTTPSPRFQPGPSYHLIWINEGGSCGTGSHCLVPMGLRENTLIGVAVQGAIDSSANQTPENKPIAGYGQAYREWLTHGAQVMCARPMGANVKSGAGGRRVALGCCVEGDNGHQAAQIFHQHC